MQKLTIPFTGINRSVDEGISQDGQTFELINARVKNGSVEPVGKPTLEQQFPREPMFVHKNMNYEHYITYGNGILYYEYDRIDGIFSRLNQQITQIENLKSIESLGNTLILITENDIQYALFKNDSYLFLGTRPELPIIKFGSVGSLKTFTSETLSYPTSTDEEKKTFTTAITGAMNKAMDEAVENGYIYKISFIRYAIRLFDGSLILHSPIYVLKPENYASFNTFASSGGYKATAKTEAYLISFQVYDDRDISLWSDIISSVDIYAYLQTPYKENAELPTGHTVGNVNMPLLDNLSSIFDEVSGFYLIKSIPIGDVADGLTSETVNGIPGIRLSSSLIRNILQAEKMQDDNLTHHAVTGNASYVYNNSLHIGDIKTRLSSGLPYVFFAESWGSTTETTASKSFVITNLKSDSGESILISESNRVGILNLPLFGGINQIVSYPDRRATRMRIVPNNESNYGLDARLKKHPFLNLAYYQEPNLNPIHGYNVVWTAGVPLHEENVFEYSPNKIKVSETINPFVFPIAKTYTVSNGKVLGMRAATMALSSNQSGQFPLYVFSSDGLNALEVGSGSVSYTNVAHISRDCCNNKDSIISTDNAVVFVTNRGLMMVSGRDVALLSSALEGYLPSYINSSQVIAKIADIPKLKNAISQTEFFHYAEGASIGYNYEAKEIIVSNKNYPYSYVYGIETGLWYKISVSVEKYINSYPECFAYFSDGGLYNMQNNHRTVNDVLIFTRPIKLGSLTHKRILQAAIRGVIRPALSDVYLRGEPVMFRGEGVTIFNRSGFYILGSNDAEHFTLIAGRDEFQDIRDVITKMNKTKAYKYFMVCLVGGVRTDVAFNYIELLVDESFTNRLR